MSLRSRSGFSLIEVLITSSIVIVIALSFASLTQSLFKEFKGLSQKADAAEIRNSMILAFANSNVCSWQLLGRVIRTSGVTAVTSSSTNLNFDTLYAGMNTSSRVIAKANTPITVAGSSMVVDSIHFKDIFYTGVPNEYVGTFYITFKNESLIRPLKDVTAQVVFLVDPADPANARGILGCTSAGAKAFDVENSHLKKFHDGIDVGCLNMNNEKMYWDSACFRYCSPGCKPGGMNQTCTAPIAGQGYPGGVAVECGGSMERAVCLCLR